MNRREMLLGTVAAAGGGYALWDIGVLSLPDGMDAPDVEAKSGEVTLNRGRASAETTTSDSSDGFFQPTDWSNVPKLTHKRINEFRSSEGRTELRWSPALADMAHAWATEMQVMNRLEHRSGDLIQTASQYGAQCDSAGENIAQT